MKLKSWDIYVRQSPASSALWPLLRGQTGAIRIALYS